MFMNMKQTARLTVVAFALVLGGLVLYGSGTAHASVGALCNDSSGNVGSCLGTCAGATTAVSDASGNCAASENCCIPAAAGGGGAGGTVGFSNPLGFSTVQEAVGAFLAALQGIIVLLALVFLVLGGVLYVISAGDEGKIKTAKGAITAAMIGLAIGIAAPSFLKEISTILNWGGPVPAGVTAAPSLATILTNVLNFLLSIVGILAIIMMVIGGLMYFAAAGDEKRAETAKTIVKYAIIGIAVALASLVAVTQIAKFFT